MSVIPARRLGAAGLLLLATALVACSPAGPSPTDATSGASTSAPAVAQTPAADPGVNPPMALLSVEGGDPVAGAMGSFQWDDVGSASPWLPGTPISVGVGEIVTMTVDPAEPIASWRARAAAQPDGSLANGLSNGGQTVSFGVPGPGAWTIEITVQFGDGQGSESASYYWRMTVE